MLGGGKGGLLLLGKRTVSGRFWYYVKVVADEESPSVKRHDALARAYGRAFLSFQPDNPKAHLIIGPDENIPFTVHRDVSSIEIEMRFLVTLLTPLTLALERLSKVHENGWLGRDQRSPIDFESHFHLKPRVSCGSMKFDQIELDNSLRGSLRQPF